MADSLLAEGIPAVIVELDKSGVPQRRWLHATDSTIVPLRLNQRDRGGGLAQSLRRTARDAFMPVGWPHSVSEDYLAYQTFDSLQAFFSTITALLANRALLQGLGVGDASSSATFALMLTILKDATSRVATIVFAHRFGLAIEPDAKRFRFLADLFNDLAFFLELASPCLSPWGRAGALAVGEALRAMCGVAAGASKAALSSHFARLDNLAELNAKEASQETAVGLVGLLVGTLAVQLVESPAAVLWLMVGLVLAHLATNYLAVRSVVVSTFNRQRASIVFEEYLERGRVLGPREVAVRERILTWRPIVRRHWRIAMARSYFEAASVRRGVRALDADAYSIFPQPMEQRILIMLRYGATPKDAVEAWYEAMIVALGKIRERDWDRLYDGLVAKGWDFGSQGLETSAPIRIMVVADKPDKEE